MTAELPDLREQSAAELGINRAALTPFLAAVGPFAVVDLETTGLGNDPDAEILEVGFALLDPSRETVRTFSSIVKPGRPLPPAIVRLTGLTDADVEGAATLASLAPGIAAALRGHTLVAHNADFERDFLGRFVARELADATYLDTQDLLALTHPDAPDLRLESFTRMLLSREEQHRALEDALDTLRVLSRLAEGAARGVARYVTAQRAIERFAPDSAWAALLQADFAVDAGAQMQFVDIGATEEARVPFDEEAIAAALADAARGARHLPGYRVRKEQIEMARYFARTLQGGGTLLLEGGTGVGKSLAYLAAAIPFAMERAAASEKQPIVISTRTKLLQDQLLKKDIGVAARFLGYSDLKALSIKGRANYVCQRRLRTVLAEGSEPSIFAEDRHAYAVMMCCAATRPHGEVGSLPAALMRRYPPLRDLKRRSVAARSEQCSREECAREKSCPFGRRRAALAKAHLVVANHDLLLRWPADYPSFTHTIVDEAHELAGVADEVYALMVRPEEVIERIDELFGRPSDKGTGSALLPRGKRRGVEKDVRAWRRGIYQDLVSIGHTMGERASEYGEFQLPAYADRILPEAAELADVVARRIEAVADQAEALDERDGEDDAASAVEKTAGELRGAAEGLRLAFTAKPDEAVAAFERLQSPFDGWTLAIRPVSPAGAFHRGFMQKLESFTAVSASLFVGDDAFAAIGELEIEERSLLDVTRVSLPSPFPYADHMRLVAMNPDGDLVEATAEVIADLVRRLGGRTLGLFTSLRRMNQVAEILARELRGEGFDILAPRRAADDPAALVERFVRSGGGGVLLGARTFWQGLDIPGEDLQAVVIEKLPFEVPTELRKRREGRLRAAGIDAFERYSLGKMLLSLKQMSGRLIRSEDDRGLVVIVEGRTDRRYFQSIRKALAPGTPIRQGGLEVVAEVLEELGLGRPLTDRDSQS